MTGRDDGSAAARIAEELAPGVLAEAIVRARELAITRVAERLADVIIERALAGEGDRSAAIVATRAAQPVRSAAEVATSAAQEAGEPAEGAGEPAEEPAAEAAEPTGEAAEPAGAVAEAGAGAEAAEAAEESVLYAYAVAGADLPVPDAPDVALSLVTDGDLGLLVSPAHPDELQVDADDLSERGRLAVLARRHDAVVRAAAADGPVLPLRFGTAVPDEEAARELLRRHADTARRQLARIGDGREWGVRLVRTLETPVPAHASSTEREGLSGTEYLARRRQAVQQQEESRQEASRAAERLQEVLAPHATDAIVRSAAPGSSLLLDIAYLVPAGREPEFLAEVERLHTEQEPHGLSLELTGPWPPYSFATLEGDGPGGT